MDDRYFIKAKQKNWRELPQEEWWITGYYVLGLNVYEQPVHLIFEPTSMFYSYGETDGWTEIDSDTICQCTGLQDKHGNMIWENDVVSVTDEDDCSGQIDTGLGYILFLEGMWYIDGKVQNGLYDIDKSFQVEIVGNIFDNPELIER